MRRLVPVLCLLLTACIEDRAPTAEAETDAMAEPEREPEGICRALPACPDGAPQVETCREGAVCDTFENCGRLFLCELCPPGEVAACPVGFREVDACLPGDEDCSVQVQGCGEVTCDFCPAECAADETLVAECLEGDPLCRNRTECGRTYGCQSDRCQDADPCPEGTTPDPNCDPADPACTVRCSTWCAAISPACPMHTRPVDGCLPEDPLCWTLDDGQACLAEICPVADPCVSVSGQPVDACAPDALGCVDLQRCGEAFTCQVIDHNCCDGQPECDPGFRAVRRCAPNGLPCRRLPGCCAEIYCEACPAEQPDCGP